MRLPQLVLRRSPKTPPVLLLFGAQINETTITAQALYAYGPIRSRSRVAHAGVKYDLPRIPQGFMFAELTLERA